MLPDSSVVGYAYDPNGNRIYSSAVEESSSSSSSSESSLESSSSSSGSSGEEAGTYYEYDYENRLIEVIEEGERFAIYRYQYDYRTRREGRREPGHETHIVFSGGSSILEYGYDGPSEPRVEYVRGHDYGGGVGGLEYSVRGGAASFNFYDSRGDVTTKTDNTGTVTFQTGYEAFGNQTAQAGTPPADRQRASTKEQDPTGLLNEGFRYRDPSTGAFITRDPLGFQAGPNMYTYVRQNPWTKFDPMGLDSSQPNPPPPKIPQPKSPWFGINPGSAAGKILQDMEHAVMPIVQAAEKTARKVATDIIKTMRSIIPNIRSKIADVRAMEQAMRDESTDYMGRVNEAAVLTNEWATGTGPTWNNFYDGPPQVNEMMRSAGMQEAREYYYKKFAGLPIDQWGSVRNLPYKFGVKGLVNAGLNPTQQFVGSFQVWIYTQPNHTAYFYVYNRTSLNSLLYDHGPAYSRDFNLMGMAQIHNIPGGNTYQSFQWSESIPNK